MINCNLFSEIEEKTLQSTIYKRISAIYVYTLQYEGNLDVCAFMQLLLESDICVTITTGSFADNLTLINNSDFLNEKNKYLMQDGVAMKVNTGGDLEELIGEMLIGVECVQKPNEEYYWQLKLKFPKKVLNIHTLVDELKFSIDDDL